MLKFIIALFFLSSFFNTSIANKNPDVFFKKELLYKNRRAKYPLGVNLILLGPSGLVGGSFDYFITSKMNFEGGVGLSNSKSAQPNYFAGLKYHILGNSISNTTFYFGGFVKNNFNNTTNEIIQELYLPIGLQKIKKNKFSWNIELAYKYDVAASKSIVWGAFKLGYRFKMRKSKLNLN
jgi:hypothetical protein